MAIMGNLELSLKLIELGKSPLKNIKKNHTSCAKGIQNQWIDDYLSWKKYF